jgi:hypothetical protein
MVMYFSARCAARFTNSAAASSGDLCCGNAQAFAAVIAVALLGALCVFAYGFGKRCVQCACMISPSWRVNAATRSVGCQPYLCDLDGLGVPLAGMYGATVHELVLAATVSATTGCVW